VRGSSDSLITESWPANWVELYNLLLEGHEDVFSTILKVMTDGVQYVGSDAEREERKGGPPNFHCEFS
jgi:hypothetical protein